MHSKAAPHLEPPDRGHAFGLPLVHLGFLPTLPQSSAVRPGSSAIAPMRVNNRDCGAIGGRFRRLAAIGQADQVAARHPMQSDLPGAKVGIMSIADIRPERVRERWCFNGR
jgi:hypothetical protein